MAVLERIAAERGTIPQFIRMDNGPELTANALRDWCRFSGAGTSYIEPGSPWQNPLVESYGSRIRDELLAIEHFDTLLEAQVLVEDWRRSTTHIDPTRPSACSRPSSLPSSGGTKPTTAHITGGPINGVRSLDLPEFGS